MVLRRVMTVFIILFSFSIIRLACSGCAKGGEKDAVSKKSEVVKEAGKEEKGAEPVKKTENPVVVMETSMGTIRIELLEKNAPISVKNFIDYVNKGFYDGTIFHRVISNFMIQGGGFTPDLEKKPTGPPIKNEANNGLSNIKGTIEITAE